MFALVLLPMFIAVPLVCKYIDLNQTAEESSRYVAFEAAARKSSNAWKTDTQLAAEVRRRFFSNSDAPVKTDDTAGDFAADRNPVWTDHTGKPLIDNFDDDVGVNGKVQGLNAIASALYRGSLGLSNHNLYTGTVTVKMANVKNFDPFDHIDLSTSRKTVLLADAWTARNPSSIRSKIESSLALYPIGHAAPLINAIGKVPAILNDPALAVSDFDWDAVPCDRLIGGC